MNKPKAWFALIAVFVLALFPLLAFAQQQPNTGGSPLSSPQEANEATVMLLITATYGAVFRPTLNWAVNKMPSVPNDVSSAIMAGATLLLYVAAWKLFGGKTPNSPTDLVHWITEAFAALGVGSTASSVVPVIRAFKK